MMPIETLGGRLKLVTTIDLGQGRSSQIEVRDGDSLEVGL